MNTVAKVLVKTSFRSLLAKKEIRQLKKKVREFDETSTDMEAWTVALMLFLLFRLFWGRKPNALDPKGPAAQWIYDNMLLSLYVMTFVPLLYL